MSAIRYSVVVPVYNSASTLDELCQRVASTMEQVSAGAWELVLVNDGSADGSWEKLRELCARDDRLTAINLSRNYGQHNAIMCGLRHAVGENIVTLDDDLQHPPEEIPKLVDCAAHSGYDVVYGRYEQKMHGGGRNLGSWAVRRAFKAVFGNDPGLSSFRLIRGAVARKILTYDRSFTFIDGLLAWHTSSFGSAAVAHRARGEGRSGYNLWRLANLAMDMLTNFSTWPLKAATLLGFIFSISGFFLGAYFGAKKVFYGIPVTGYASLIVAIAIFSGVQLVTLGIVGEYIGRVHLNVNRRPQYSTSEIVGRRSEAAPPPEEVV